jgi:hypothetical protein
MTDDSIKAKALALVNDVRAELKRQPFGPELCGETFTALCRAIEQHEAFKQKVSDALKIYSPENRNPALGRFIISKPKPDPLEEVLLEIDRAIMWADICAEEIRASLEARGFEIREKGQ